MSSKIKKFILTHISIIVILLCLLLGLCFTVLSIVIRKNAIDRYYDMIGKAYQKDEQYAEFLIDYLYEDTINDDLDFGKMVIEKSGYTSEGLYLIKNRDIMIYIITYIISFIILLLLIILAIYYKKSFLLQLSKERESIIQEIAYSQIDERALIEKKNSQTQNYVENVAHQVRTPLSNIMINIDMLYDNQSKENKQILDECNYHIERVNKLMDRLLKVGKLEAGQVVFEKREENLAEIVRKIVATYKDNRIFTKLEDIYILVDYDWIYEAVDCIVENCMEHIGYENQIVIILKKLENKAVLTIEDDGAGFIKEELSYIFDRFFTADSRTVNKHYGIGLNMSKLIIEAHYGTIHAYNAKDKGAGFQIELPLLKLKSKMNI